jgi:flavin reductase (DIM6/NTAB) family NADH-FMN oxidoreductase RutF
MKKSIGAKTIVFPTPVFIVGTYDKAGKPNVMTAAWGGICCSSPPCVAVSLRKATYTYGNIMTNKAFTASGLTPVKSDLVNAPYVKEFPLVLECEVLHTLEIGLHTQFVGEIMDVKADKAVVGKKGLPDVEKVRPFSYAPEGRAYYRIGSFLGKAFSIGKKI